MSRRFLLRQIIFSIGHDSWVMDEHDQKVFLIDQKTVALRKTYIMYDMNHQEVLKIQHQPLHLHRTMTIEQQGRTVATVQKAWLTVLRDRWNIQIPDADDWVAQGDLLDHEYSITRSGQPLAQISKKWFAIRESYGVDIYEDALSPLMIALTVAIDDMMHAEEHSETTEHQDK